jgi:colanic acid/amylovoran biosynthesis glycosyltransferase
MPNVAVFSTHFVPYSQTFVHEELRHLARYEAEVFCRKRMNAEQFPFDAVHVAGPTYGVTRVDRSFESAFQRRRYDVVHAHFGTGAVYALRYAQKFGRPLVVTFHGYDVPLLESVGRFHPKHLRYAMLGPRVLKSMTLGLCASRELMDLLIDFGVPRERLRLHHIGIDTRRFQGEPRAPSETASVVLIGRFVEKKGFEYGIRAFARAASTRRARLTLIGDGELAPRLKRLVRELGIADRVEFAGVVPSDEIARRLQQTDVLLAPSVVAAFGDRESGLLTAKEASASGVPPIGTLHGGIPEIIDDGVTGFLVPERDVAAMADRLGRLLDDPELRQRMGRAARQKMEQMYDIRATVRALEERYDEARGLQAERGESARP